QVEEVVDVGAVLVPPRFGDDLVQVRIVVELLIECARPAAGQPFQFGNIGRARVDVQRRCGPVFFENWYSRQRPISSGCETGVLAGVFASRVQSWGASSG